MSLLITGIGTALPTHRISQADAAAIAKQYACETPAQERLFQTLYRRAGVEGKNSVVLDTSEGPLETRQTFYGTTHPTTLDRMRRYESEAGPLAVAACEEALRDCGLDPGHLTHLVTISCSGFYAPGFDIAVVKRLGLNRGVARTHIGFMGCQGALNALRVARSFVEADPGARVLICALELCSLHHQYGWDADKVVANALFADGAAAVVAVRDGAATRAVYRHVASGSVVIDDSEDVMSWRIGDHGFDMGLSPRLPEVIATSLRPWLERWLREHELSIEQVGTWAVHPGGPRILSAFSEATGVAHDALRVSQGVLADHGNMSSPTILFILDRLRKLAAPAPAPCVAVGFGPGLTVETALFR